MKPPVLNNDWDERTSASEELLGHSGAVFGSFLERSVDAIWLLDPQGGVFVDCSQAGMMEGVLVLSRLEAGKLSYQPARST